MTSVFNLSRKLPSYLIVFAHSLEGLLHRRTASTQDSEQDERVLNFIIFHKIKDHPRKDPFPADMSHFAAVFVVLLVQLTLASTAANVSTVFSTSATTLNATSLPTKQSCVPRYSNINTFLKEIYCKPYNYSKNGYCKDIIKDRDIYGNTQHIMEKNLQKMLIGKRMLEVYIPEKVRDSCLKYFNDSFCQYSFPKCDLTSIWPKPRPVCRETCDDVYKRCDKELELLKGFNLKPHQDALNGDGSPLYWKIINCTELQYRNGGDLPECYFSRHLNTETDKLEGSECYYGNGFGYRGNVSVTRSGHVCQSWSSQCPHRHDHPLSEYPELVNASNFCRNPGGQGPNGPWCYTTNSNVRWEYCDVDKCPPPAPTLAPEITAVYSNGPSKVFIKWNAVPLPFMHGHPRGFRIHISQFNQESMTNMISPNITSFEYTNLQALTNYSISVLAFNDAGDGPYSRAYVKTMPQNSVTVKYTMNLTFPPPSRNFQHRDEAKGEKQAFVFKNSVLKLFERRRPDGYSIHQMKVIEFTHVGDSKYQAKFVMTAELKGRSSWSVVQDITGRLLRLSQTKPSSSKEFKIKSFSVETSPPPPANLSKSHVEKTSVTVHWSVPLHNGPYKITNYTVQHKKAGTNLKYYDAETVSANKTKVTVKNLDAGQEYLMRVAAFNAHGFEASEPMAVKTKESDKVQVLAIVLPFVAVILLLFIVGVLFVKRKRKESVEMQKKLEKFRENPYDSAVDWFEVLKIKITKQWWEIPRDDLEIDEQLGSGAFGVVMRGYLTKREEENKGDRVVCAVKMLKDNPTERELRDLCNEINIMSSVGDHPNLVSLIGGCTINGPLWLVVKFAANGCLLDYLKDNRPTPEYQNTKDLNTNQPRPKGISEKERMRFAYEIAQGMAHLERHRYIHRDLAARNVLLGKNMAAMVSDFGMSRDIYESGVYENTAGGILPVRWMALESLQYYAYTSKSDVWSYGVLLWEIETGGLMPYAGMSGAEFVGRLRQGYRLERPHTTSRNIYEVMWQCWNPDPQKRPTFADLVYNIGGLFHMTMDIEDTTTEPNNNRDAFKPELEDKTERAFPDHQIVTGLKNSAIEMDIDV